MSTAPDNGASVKERTKGEVELVAKELWWAQESAEVPPDKTRWFAAALALTDAEFAALLAVAESEAAP